MTIDSQHAPVPRPGAAVDVLFCARAPMRDGVELGVQLHRPHGERGPWPVVMEVTPYGTAMNHADGLRLAASGFAFVSVDCRGTGESGGRFVPGVHEIEDYRDVMDWVASQPWCNGSIGLYGGSYSGLNQWCAYATRHPALKTIVPSAAAMFGYGMPAGGIGSPYLQRWGVLSAAQGSYADLFSDIGYWHRIWAEHWRAHRDHFGLPQSELGTEMNWSHRFLEQPGWSAFWNALVPSAADYAAMGIPVLSLTGQYDSCQLPALAHHLRLETMGSDAGRAGNHLVIGPWDHSSVNDGAAHAGNLRFGPQCRIDILQLKIEWYRWALMGGPKPAFLRQRIVYWQAGEEAWHSCDRLAEVSSGTATMTLAAAAGPNDVFHSGWLGAGAPETEPYHFTCDPFDSALIDIELLPREDEVHGFGAAGGSAGQIPFNSMFMTLAGDEPTSQAFATHLRGQGLVYHSAPLESPLALAGRPQLELHCALDGADADLVMLLYEVRADGRCILLSSDALRLRYRDGFDREVLATPGVPFLARLADARFFARTLARHSRLRLVVRNAASLSLQKNGHSGKPVHEEAPVDARRLRVTVLHSGPQRSRLLLPLAAPTPTFTAQVMN
jgi:predicted acyl esterase